MPLHRRAKHFPSPVEGTGRPSSRSRIEAWRLKPSRVGFQLQHSNDNALVGAKTRRGVLLLGSREPRPIQYVPPDPLEVSIEENMDSTRILCETGVLATNSSTQFSWHLSSFTGVTEPGWFNGSQLDLVVQRCVIGRACDASFQSSRNSSVFFLILLLPGDIRVSAVFGCVLCRL